MRSLDTNFSLFLKQLVEQKEIPSITSLARLLGFSRRTIYHYLEKCNYLLGQEGNAKLMSEAGRLSLSASQADIIKCWLDEEHVRESILTTSERRQVILALFLIESKKWQLSSLQSVLNVSRNTVLNDIQSLRAKLLDQELEIKSVKARGYFIPVGEVKRRELLYDFVHRTETENSKLVYDTLLDLATDENEAEEATSFRVRARRAVETAEKILSKKNFRTRYANFDENDAAL